jgi:cell division protease FtsH
LSSTLRTLFLWMAIFVVVILLWNLLSLGQAKPAELTFTEFMTQVGQEQVKSILIKDRDTVEGTYLEKGEHAEGETFTLDLPFEATPEFIAQLENEGIEISSEKTDQNPLFAILITWGPILLLIGLWIFFMRQMQTGGNKALSFGKSKAKLLSASGKKVTFKDVAGVEEAKEELSEIVEFLKEPAKFQKLGGRIPKGVLLMGPPGTGKTLLARAIAGEANVPFFSISGSDFVEMFVGVGASRVRDLFEQGKKNAPCIIFIDEIDAVGRHRGAGLGGGHDEREQTLNQLLVEMDGFESNEGVILIAATNRPDVLDPALLRPGRFDRRVVVDRPDINGRLGILKVHVRQIPLSDDVDLAVVARGTPGFAGADLANLVNEAALIAARRNKKHVEMDDFEFAKDKVLMGVERKTLMLTDEEKRLTAFHEAGHALVAIFTPGADPLHKVTIIPRGRALGLTMQLPTEDKYTYRKSYVEAQISILMGGRVAEELTQEDITTGAGNDIERATDLARRMVREWGMSGLGPLAYGGKDEPVFLGRDFAQQSDYSQETAIRIDREVEEIVQTGYSRAREILREHGAVLERLALELLEKESLDGKEVYRLIEEMTGRDLAPAVPERPHDAITIGPEGPTDARVDGAAADEAGAEGADGGAPKRHGDEGEEEGGAVAEQAEEESELVAAQRRSGAAPAPRGESR